MELINKNRKQPPSGGCVLKHRLLLDPLRNALAATFGWLCVETRYKVYRQQCCKRSHLRVAVC